MIAKHALGALVALQASCFVDATLLHPRQANSSTASSQSSVSSIALQSSSTPSASPILGPGMFTAHPDGNCETSLSPGANDTFYTKQYPEFSTNVSVTFPGAESKPGGGGFDVWFKMSDPSPHCRNIIMVPFLQDRPTPDYPVGKQVINAGHAGCYYAHIDDESRVYTSTCCGSACQNASLNSSLFDADPMRKRHARKTDARMANLAAESGDDGSRTTGAREPQSSDALADVASGSIAGRASALVQRWWYNPPLPSKQCNFTVTGQPFSQAGQQIVVSAAQACPVAPCQIPIAQTYTVQSSVTSSSSQTLTNTEGASVSISAGFDFLVSWDISAEFKTEFSKAIQQATGHDLMNGNSTSVTNTLSLQLGTNAIATFIPTYLCYTGSYDCVSGQPDPWLACVPVINPVTKQPNGEFAAITIG